MNGENRRRIFEAPLLIVMGFTYLLLALPCAAQSKNDPSLAGHWRTQWRVLDNGETDIIYLDLGQTGTKVTGTLTSIGHVFPLTGTVSRGRFELFTSKSKTKPRMTGDVVADGLHIVQDGQDLVAVKAGPNEAYPPFATIDLPSLHSVAGNGLAMTPPMGWNSWNLFQTRIDDKTVRQMADAMVTSGMRDAGYVYINIDDTWEGVRDAHGNLGANPKFPNMKGLADYVHAKGLKLGIYSSPGPRTCAEYPGSYGHEQQDAKTFAAWGIDYVKYDWCGARMIYSKDALDYKHNLQAVYQKMGDALVATHRPIIYSLCEYGDGDVATWGADVGGNLWRTTSDIRDAWDSMLGNIEKQVPAAPHARPGHWNDPDMLEIGNGQMTIDEYRTHMSLWAVSAAPLLAGNDIRHMTPDIQAILMNRDVIAVDQDILGKQGVPIKAASVETWTRPLADGSVAVVVVNKGATATTATVKAGDLGASFKVRAARDLWAHADVTFHDGVYSAPIPSHGVLMLRVWP